MIELLELMGTKRVVKTYRDTRASGDKTAIKGNRYLIWVELVSLKIEEEADSMGRTSELYLQCGKQGITRARTPNKGAIHLDRNEVFKPRDGITLYSEFIDKKGGGTIELPFRVYDQDLGKDDKLVDTKLSVTLGQTGDYLSFSEKGVKVKIKISANRTRY